MTTPIQNPGVCNSYMEVDLQAIRNNIAKIRRHIEPQMEMMPVLKGNAYALGLSEIAVFMVRDCGIKTLACAQAWEAEQFRSAGLDCEILVMGGVPYNNIPAVVSLDLMTPAFFNEYLDLLNAEAAKQGKTAKVHIKVETGLNRIGAHPGEELDALCLHLKTLKNTKVVGAYTHFIESDAVDKALTYKQLERFKEGLAQIKGHGFELEYIHAFNTASVSWLSDSDMTHIRAAGLFFGYDPNLAPVNGLGLEEVMSWRSFVTNVKTVPAGETVGYNQAFKVTKPTRVATVSFGYGDGYSRHLAAKQGAEVLVNGKRAPILAICMDQTFIDVTGMDDVSINDQITLIGRDGDEFISVFELEKKMGQTYLATVAAITPRVKRIYINR